jgi:hypothetical protein
LFIFSNKQFWVHALRTFEMPPKIFMCFQTAFSAHPHTLTNFPDPVTPETQQAYKRPSSVPECRCICHHQRRKQVLDIHVVAQSLPMPADKDF